MASQGFDITEGSFDDTTMGLPDDAVVGSANDGAGDLVSGAIGSSLVVTRPVPTVGIEASRMTSSTIRSSGTSKDSITSGSASRGSVMALAEESTIVGAQMAESPSGIMEIVPSLCNSVESLLGSIYIKIVVISRLMNMC